jgi:hypothetical protein
MVNSLKAEEPARQCAWLLEGELQQLARLPRPLRKEDERYAGLCSECKAYVETLTLLSARVA